MENGSCPRRWLPGSRILILVNLAEIRQRGMENGEWRAGMQLRDPGPEDLDAGLAIMELFSGNGEADSRPMERGTWPMDRF